MATPHWLSKLTLDSFGKITHYDPFVFMGVKLFGLCDPLTCKTRERTVEAYDTAFGMMDSFVASREKSTFDTNVVLESIAPYFDLNGYQPKVLTETTYAATITYPVGYSKTDYSVIATVTLTINALDALLHEEFVEALAVFPDLACKRFGVGFLGDPVFVGNIVTLKARGYNFIDVDNITDPANPPYLAAINIVVTTKKDASPLAYWPTANCDNNSACAYTTTGGCLLPTRSGYYDVRFNRYCPSGLPTWGNYSEPAKFSLTAMRNGCWRNTWNEALVGLSNCLMAEDFCGCDPLSNQKFREDRGESSRLSKVYPYSYYNIFGITMPGAQRAQKIIELTLGSSVMFSM